MKRKLVSIITVLALWLSLCPVPASAAEISAPLDFTAQASNTSGDGYTWAADTKTLTLNAFTQTISDAKKSVKAIILPADATLVLQGESTITNSSRGGTCIQYEGNLTIQGGGTLNLNLNMGTNTSCGNGIYEKSDTKTDNVLTIEDGVLNITGEKANTDSNGYVGLSGAEVRLNGGTVNMENVTYGVNAYYWWVEARRFLVDGGTFWYGKSADYTGDLRYAVSGGSNRDNTGFSEVSITDGTVDISGALNAFSVAKTPVSVTGGSLRIHDLVRQTASTGVEQNTHAFLCGAGSRTDPEPKIRLTGDDIDISGCDYILTAVNILGMDMLEIGEGLDITGLVRVDEYGIDPANISLGTSHVRVYGEYTLAESLSFHGGNSGFWDIGLAEGGVLTIPAGMTFDLSQLVPPSEDNNFNGHGDAYDFSGGTIINNGILKLPENSDTQEQFKPVNITGGGQILMGSKTVYPVAVTGGSADRSLAAAGETVTLTTEESGTRRFTGWTADPDSVVIGNGNTFTMPASGVAVTGSYVDLYTVSFDSRGGSAAASQTVESGQTASRPTAPVREGYSFAGWFTDEACKTAYDFSAPVTASLTLYAKWRRLLPDPPAAGDGNQYQLVMDEGISQVPAGLLGIEELNTPEKLETFMRTAVTQAGTAVPQENTVVYEVELQISTDGGVTWTKASPNNFPANGLTVTLPYPAGTDSTYTFTVAHMFTTSDFGKTPGATESPTVTNTEQGLRFTVTGLSPVSVGWTRAAGPTDPTDPTDPADPTPPSGGHRGSSSGGSRGSYTVTVESARHGRVTCDRRAASRGSTVTLTVTPDSGYVLDSLHVTDSKGNRLEVTGKGNGRYTFIMPADTVRAEAGFVPAEGSETSWVNPFRDAAEDAWYFDAVRFVSENSLMSGYGSGLFGPDDPLTRAQFAQILYNREGRPAVTGDSGFTDVASGAWCAPAVTWAAERGIAGGCGDGTFRPGSSITRQQLAVMLWRYAGSPAAERELDFTDADQAGGYALDALRWAAESGVLNGYRDGRLNPQGQATRAQTAQMLKNLFTGQL